MVRKGPSTRAAGDADDADQQELQLVLLVGGQKVRWRAISSSISPQAEGQDLPGRGPEALRRAVTPDSCLSETAWAFSRHCCWLPKRSLTRARTAASSSGFSVVVPPDNLYRRRKNSAFFWSNSSSVMTPAVLSSPSFASCAITSSCRASGANAAF